MNCFTFRFCVFTRVCLFVLELVILSLVFFIFVVIWLSVPVQSTAWKESFPKMTYYVSEWYAKPYTLTHLVVHPQGAK